MLSANVLKDVTTEHNTNKQSEEVPMQLPNSAPAIDDDAQDSRKVMEDDSHTSNDTEVPEANDDFEHHQEDHASPDSTNSETVSSTQVPQVHSSRPILKKVVTDDIEKIKKAWEEGDGSTSNDKEDGFTPMVTKKGKKT
jgi:hypothetical protein